MNKIYRAARLPLQYRSHPGLPMAQGFVEKVESRGDALLVEGWMLHPDHPFDSVQVYFNDKRVLSSGVIVREDVGRAVAWVPHAANSGFFFKMPLSKEDRHQTGRIDLIGCAGGKRLARLGTLVNEGIYQLPAPPPEYCSRVSNMRCQTWFRVTGMKTFGDFMEAICRHRKFGSIKRMLDWGCGCGRVTTHFLAIANGPQVFGCDIDGEMIAWANEHLQPGTFAPINPLPPTLYPDGYFDLIISYSVLTHLTRDVQHAWLAEMRRILAPGGLFVASVHGFNASQYLFQTRHPQLPESGFTDEIIDPILNGIAPENYYRDTCQTPQYTFREFGKHFHVLEYLEQGAMNYQDLVIMEKPRLSLSRRLLATLLRGKAHLPSRSGAGSGKAT